MAGDNISPYPTRCLPRRPRRPGPSLRVLPTGSSGWKWSNQPPQRVRYGNMSSIKDDCIVQLPSLTEPTWPEPSSLTRSDEEIASGILTTAHRKNCLRSVAYISCSLTDMTNERPRWLIFIDSSKRRFIQTIYTTRSSVTPFGRCWSISRDV